jgi:hypothetical protein
MLLSRFWKHHRHLLGWSTFLLAIGGVGVALYLMLPPEPRWVLADGPKTVFYAGEGKFASYRLHENASSGPLQLWDAGTGVDLGRFLESEGPFLAQAHSEDGRFFVAVVKAENADTSRICGVDLHERREWRVDTPVSPIRSATFSAGGNFVALVQGRDAAESQAIVHTASGRIVDRFEHLSDAEDEGHFSADGSCFVIGYRDEDDMRWIRVVNTRTGKKTVIDDGRFIAVSPDARWLIADRGDEGVWVWDLASAAWHGPLQDGRAGNLRHRTLYPYPDGTASTLFLGEVRSFRHRRLGTARLWERGTGGFLWHIGAVAEPVAFSPDSRLLLWNTAGDVRSSLYDLQTAKQLWERACINAPGCTALFTPDSQRIVTALSNQVEVVNAHTVRIELAIPLSGSAEEARLTRDGRTVVVAAAPAEEPAPWLWTRIWHWLAPRQDASRTVIQAFDMESGQELGRLNGDEMDEFWLTEDRQRLLMVYQEYNGNQLTDTTIRCWDMPPQRPVRWAIGVPATLGMLLVSVRFGWRRWRQARSPGPNTATPAGLSGR